MNIQSRILYRYGSDGTISIWTLEAPGPAPVQEGWSVALAPDTDTRANPDRWVDPVAHIRLPDGTSLLATGKFSSLWPLPERASFTLVTRAQSPASALGIDLSSSRLAPANIGTRNRR